MADGMNTTTPLLGVLTRTLNPSSVWKHVLRFELSDAVQGIRSDFLVFVGERCFELRGFEDGGYIRRLCRTEVDSDVLAAKTLYHHERSENLLLLAMSNAYVVLFRFAVHNGQYHPDLVSRRAFPNRSDPLERLGSIMEVDAGSGSVVVGGPEGGLIIWRISRGSTSIKRRTSQYRHTIDLLEEPITITRTAGHILKVAFSSPLDESSRETDLLTVESMNSRLCLRKLALDTASSTVDIQEAQRIDSLETIPDLMIPIDTPGYFVLASSQGLALYNAHHHTGGMMVKYLGPVSRGPNAQQLVDETAVWVSWAKVAPEPLATTLSYLVLRSDGLIVHLHLDLKASNDHGNCFISLNAVTILPHPVDSGAACIRDTSSGNIVLAVTGAQCDGSFYEVGIGLSKTIQGGTLVLSKLQGIPNESPTLDFVSSNLQRSHDVNPRVGESLFLTAGDPENGRLVESRPGLEASILFSLDFNAEVHGTHLWIARITTSGTSALVMSDLTSKRPSHTNCLIHDGEGLVSVDDDSFGLLLAQGMELGSLEIKDPTILLQSSPDGQIALHVTMETVSLRQGATTSQLLTTSRSETIIKADAHLSRGLCVILVARTGDDLSHHIKVLRWTTVDSPPASVIFENSLPGMPGASIILPFGDSDYLVTVAGNVMHIHQLEGTFSTTMTLEQIAGDDSACGDLTVLRNQDSRRTNLLCGMRNGTVINVALKFEEGILMLEQVQDLTLGLTPVSLVTYNVPHGEQSGSVATCGSRLYLIQLEPGNIQGICTATPLWVTDRDEPDFQVNTISAVAQVPNSLVLDGMEVKDCLAVVTRNGCLIVHVDVFSGPCVPRSLSVGSSPSRVLYSGKLGHFAAAGMSYSNGQLTGHVEFVKSSKRARVKVERDIQRGSAFIKFPRERVLSMIEWIHESRDGKKFAFLLVGTGLAGNEEGPEERRPSMGRVHLLQPKLSHGVIASVTIATTTKFDQPVLAIALYGSNGYICSSEDGVAYYMYSPSKKKWQETCTYRLHSPAISITATPPFIHLSTSRDSLMTLQVIGPAVEATDENLAPSAFRLHLISVDKSSAPSQHHLTIPSPFPESAAALNILTTKTASVRGLLASLPSESSRRSQRETSQTLFSCNLPSSIIRLKAHNTSLLPSSPSYSIIGLTTAGALIGLKLLSPEEWAVLKHIESLCKRSWRVCPTDARHLKAASFTGEEGGEGRALPMGLKGLRRYEAETEADFETRTGIKVDAVRDLWAASKTGEEMDIDRVDRVHRDDHERTRAGGWEVFDEIKRSESWGEEDMHVDGDLLRRLVVNGGTAGEDMLTQILREEGQRADRLGLFIAERIDEEEALVPRAFTLVQKTLSAWGFW
ncbi:hypothetical protein CAC42_4962 [Sphaceloma murrayae]|uniref:RSE1/DDB1/CPSF1 first beta-propeller domain-containing protein n=1 Tax=Sphaceloma murrayae TaxID=2082308 RepID=A0A2K1QPH1_9PEZI|nr:hypothetical protein CAC42_4962 [Sphaceloma murrayae]